jgi:hypothetical protein
MTWLRTLIARLMAGVADDGSLMRELAALSRDHTHDMRDHSKEPRGDGV